MARYLRVSAPEPGELAQRPEPLYHPMDTSLHAEAARQIVAEENYETRAKMRSSFSLVYGDKAMAIVSDIVDSQLAGRVEKTLPAPSCTCGGDIAKTPHSHDCPRRL